MKLSKHLNKIAEHVGRKPKLVGSAHHIDGIHVIRNGGSRTTFNTTIIEEKTTEATNLKVRVRSPTGERKEYPITKLRKNKGNMSVYVTRNGLEEIWKIPQRLNKKN